LLPFLYVKLAAKKSFGWIGFRLDELSLSTAMGVLFSIIAILIWYPVFTFYPSLSKNLAITPYLLFTV